MPLLKRVSDVRTGRHAPRIAETPIDDIDTPCAQEPMPPAVRAKTQTISTKKRAKMSKGFGRIDRELSQIAAIKRPLTDEEMQRLDELVKETKAIAAVDDGKVFRLLHQRARLVRKSKTAQSKGAARHSAVAHGSHPAPSVGTNGIKPPNKRRPKPKRGKAWYEKHPVPQHTPAERAAARAYLRKALPLPEDEYRGTAKTPRPKIVNGGHPGGGKKR